MIRVLSVVLFGACLVALGSAENSFANVDQKPSTFVLCKNQKNVRTIKVLPDQAKPENCTITYMKGGVDEVVGSGRSMDNCRSIVKNIKSNLESSNWSCRSVQSASVMQSAEVARQ